MLDLLAPQVGLEPTTLRLTAECSAIELLRSVALTSSFIKLTERFRSVKNCLVQGRYPCPPYDWPSSFQTVAGGCQSRAMVIYDDVGTLDSRLSDDAVKESGPGPDACCLGADGGRWAELGSIIELIRQMGPIRILNGYHRRSW